MFPGGFWNDVAAIDVSSVPREQPTKRYYLIEFSVPEPTSLMIAVTGTVARSSVAVNRPPRRP